MEDIAKLGVLNKSQFSALAAVNNTLDAKAIQAVNQTAKILKQATQQQDTAQDKPAASSAPNTPSADKEIDDGADTNISSTITPAELPQPTPEVATALKELQEQIARIMKEKAAIESVAVQLTQVSKE